MIIYFNVDKVLKPFHKYDKDFYPVSVKDLKGPKGSYIFNSLVKIPNDTKIVQGELYLYKGDLRIKNIVPVDASPTV